MKKENQKNTTIRIALLVLMFVMITSSLVGGTFAKYISDAKASDQARVAKWGITPKATISLFDVSYNEGKIHATDKVVAPGASGSYEFKFVAPEGSNPEVAYKLKANVTGEYSDEWLALEGNYFPVVFRLDDQASAPMDLAALTAQLTAIETDPILPGESLSQTTPVHTIFWEWPFTDDAGTQDAKDTVLGNSGANLSVKLEIEVIAEQVN